MMFVLRMAVRETRASWRRLLFFFVCIAVGVAAIVALRSVIQSVRGVVNTEARALVGADVVISTNRDWPAEARQKIESQLAEAGAFARTETTETPTMVRPADGSAPIAKMAELRAVQAAYPLYGAISLQDGQVYSHALLEHHGALVRPELLTALQVKAGDRIAVGLTTFTIRGVSSRGSLAAVRVASAWGRGSTSTTTTCRPPGCSGSAAAPSGCCSSACRTIACRRS